MGFRGTYWRVLDRENAPDDTDSDKTFHRELMDYQLDLSTEVYDILHTGGGEIDR